LLRFKVASFLICLLSFSLIVKSDENSSEFIISYVEHESIIEYYVPILDEAYRSIGIIPKFVLINDKRALKLLDKGLIDADTAKTTEILADYPNIIKIPTPISKIEVILICHGNITCNLSVLDEAQKVLGVIGAKEFYSNLLHDSRVNVIEVSSFDVLLKLFKQKKLDFIFMVFDDHNKTIDTAFKNQYSVEKKTGYHLVNKNIGH
jgi:hypothetical protein